MNKKKTNLFATILNTILLITAYTLIFATGYLISSRMTGGDIEGAVYGGSVFSFFVTNILIIESLIFCIIGFFSIILAIQNKKNRKLCFWQIILSIFEFWTAISFIISDMYILEWGNKIIFGVIPILFTIINLILAKKHNKIMLIKIFSYIGIIIFSIIVLLRFEITYDYIFEQKSLLICLVCWSIIAITMQLIYIHYQDEKVIESNGRKKFNIILYYILELMFTIIVAFFLVYSLLTTMINENKLKVELRELYKNITTLQGSEIKDECVPVVKNNKYGFINKKGQENVPCEYDKVTYFYEFKINDNFYYVALAKKDKEYYIISKTNDSISLEKNLQKYMTKIEEYGKNDFSEKNIPVTFFGINFSVFLSREEIDTNMQAIKELDDEKTINLEKKQGKYYYENKNYSMIIEPINDENNNEQDAEEDKNYYDAEENTFHVSTYTNNTKYNVFINKANGDESSDIVYLPKLRVYEDEIVMKVFSDGSIYFENEQQTHAGWYDSKGEKITVPIEYYLMEVKDNRAILEIKNRENDNDNYKFEYIIINKNGKILLKTPKINIYDDMYLIKKENNKRVLLDNELNVISNEYDKILMDIQIEMDMAINP